MGNQTVIVLSNNQLDVARLDPQFAEQLFRAIDEVELTYAPADIGVNYGMVMPYHHRNDPTLYLSFGGKLIEIGEMTVEKLPHTREECRKLAQAIALRSLR